MNIVLSGPFGLGSLSDELVLAGVIKPLLAAKHSVTVFSADKAATSATHGVEAVTLPSPSSVSSTNAAWKALDHAHFFGVCGAGVISDTGKAPARVWLAQLEYAKQMKTATGVLGAGAVAIDDKKEAVRVQRFLHHFADSVSVRDEASKAALVAIGLNPNRVSAVGDPVLALFDEDAVKKSKPEGPPRAAFFFADGVPMRHTFAPAPTLAPAPLASGLNAADFSTLAAQRCKGARFTRHDATQQNKKLARLISAGIPADCANADGAGGNGGARLCRNDGVVFRRGDRHAARAALRGGARRSGRVFQRDARSARASGETGFERLRAARRRRRVRFGTRARTRQCTVAKPARIARGADWRGKFDGAQRGAKRADGRTSRAQAQPLSEGRRIGRSAMRRARRNVINFTGFKVSGFQGFQGSWSSSCMVMRYIVDACNLIFASHKLEETLENRGFQPARAMLVGMLERFVRAAGIRQAVAVFDGSEKGAHRPRRSTEAHGKVVLIYANPRSDADRAIIEMVEDAKRPGEITVVTGDKFIIKHVRGAGAHHVSCRDFMRQMSRANKHAADPLRGEDPRKFTTGLTPNEVDFWLEYFGIEE